MKTIKIQKKEYFYNEQEVIRFDEGLIGLPEMRRAVLIPMAECAPFCWLASVDDEKNRFVVVNPHQIYADYQPSAPETARQAQTLAIVKVSSDWTKTTVNLRAPMFIDAQTGCGTQRVLTESSYRLAEALPQI